ncbi:MAG: glycosyltransferase family 4 protein [Pseudomonadota bacterium]|nr:glycosyltransferase family 4 protein [Pseudomonadota bacterium]
MILITTQCFPPDRGGIEMLMGGLADAVHGSDEAVAVYADRAHTDAADPAPYAVKRFGGFKPLRRQLKAYAVANAVRAQNVKGLFADSWKSVELLPTLSAPIAVLAHGMEFPAAPSASKRARIVNALAKAHTLIANSAYTASLARPYLSDGDRRLRVINPPIGPQLAPGEAALTKVRDIIAGRGPVLLTLARLEPRKGVDMVIRTMPDILKIYPNAVFVVASGGDDRARLDQIAAEKAVMQSIRFTGPVDGEMKAALFASADVFVMPTRREGDSVEGFGIAFVEAGWYGVPALAGRDGGASDAVQDGQTGLLCHATDQADVWRQIERLLGDSALRHRLGAAASQRARGELQWANAINRYLDALR